MAHRCPMCADYSSPTFQLLQVHLFRVHSGDFNVTCCNSQFRTAPAYRKHVQRNHKKMTTSDCSQVVSIPECASTLSCDPEDPEDNEQTADSNSRNIAMWILKLKECNKLTQTCVDQILCHVSELCLTTVLELGEAVKSALEADNIRFSDVSGLQDLFSPSSPFCRPFNGLLSYHHQLNFYNTHLKFIRPERITLGKYQSWKTKGMQRKLVEEKDEFMYIPILKVLERMLQNQAIFEEVMRGHRRSDNIAADFCDSKQAASHPLWGSDVHALQIFLYFDEVELCNSLGASRKIHKIGCFYFTIGNIHQKYRSALKSIQLLALIKNENLREYGMNSVLKHIVADIAKLEKGVILNTIEGNIKFFGSIVTIPADNLGSHAIGGFKEGFTAMRPCRHCLTTSDEYKLKFHEKDFILRSPEEHSRMCDILEQTGNPAFHSTTYGINCRTPLNQLTFYNICDYGLPPDIMHDLLEGYVPYKTKLMLKYFIGEKQLFTLAELNSRIRHFHYGYMETKPTIIFPSTFSSNDGHLNQSASKMWTLARYLPLLIGRNVAEADPHWQHYLELLDILDLTFAQVVRPDTPSYLQVTLESHLMEFQALYPYASIIPKMHFLIHIPNFLDRIGPLVRYWTMRYEAKHQFFKHLASTMGNFVNICYSLAMRHQSFQCYALNSENFLSNCVESGPGKEVPVESIDYASVLSLADSDNIFRAKWIKVNGMLVKPKVAVISSLNDSEQPSFGEVKNMYVGKDSVVWLELGELETVVFDFHFHSWIVQRADKSSLVKFSDLACTQVLPLRPVRHSTDLHLHVTLKFSP